MYKTVTPKPPTNWTYVDEAWDYYACVFDTVLEALHHESPESVNDAVDGAFEQYFENNIAPPTIVLNHEASHD